MRALAKECRRVNGCVPQRSGPRAAPHLLTIVLPVMRLDIETTVLIINKYTYCTELRCIFDGEYDCCEISRSRITGKYPFFRSQTNFLTLIHLLLREKNRKKKIT